MKKDLHIGDVYKPTGNPLLSQVSDLQTFLALHLMPKPTFTSAIACVLHMSVYTKLNKLLKYVCYSFIKIYTFPWAKTVSLMGFPTHQIRMDR